VNLSNFKIRTKLFLLLGAMVVVIAIVAAKGYVSIDNLASDQRDIAATGHDSLLGARINQNVVALSRGDSPGVC
jgi:hypothetical protein